MDSRSKDAILSIAPSRSTTNSASYAEPDPDSEAPPDSLSTVHPTLPAEGLWPQTVALAQYMFRAEVHTYAFSVAANVILALYPFVVLLLTLSRNVFHSSAMQSVVGELMHSLLPTAQDLIMRNARPNKGAQIFSLIMLLVSSSGVFLPLEVALNDVWGVHKSRNYLHNQLISLGLAFAVGILAMASVALTAGQRTVLTWIFFGHTDNIVYHFLNGTMLSILALLASTLIFFLIYWILPNRNIPARSVLPTAIVIGLLFELAKYLYVMVLPRLDFRSVYGPFQNTVGLMMWAFLSGLLLLAGAHFSATRYAIRSARKEQGREDSTNRDDKPDLKETTADADLA